MKKIIQSMVVCVLLVVAASVGAENRANSFYFTPFMGGYLFDGSQSLNSKPVYGLRFGYNFTENIGAEAAFDYVHTYFTPDNLTNDFSTDFYQYRVDLLYHLLPNKRLDPFLAVGLGGASFNRDTFSSNNSGSFDYGAGVNYFFTDRMALRADIRHIIYNDTKTDNNLEYGLGLSFFFGGAKQSPALVIERQPMEEYKKPAAEAPAVVATPQVEKDSDNDGVVDSLDKCPGTPFGVKVDGDGCPLDSDKDGVPDYLDKCPNTPLGVKVDGD
ncbi:MAG: outer membrane beta-barrel domain-containing protein, partial [Syntrophales bacterium LBB04]|nr:outer membrane beta-barrel domain-containing protein [Syntrophales bacterium LBB04]